MIQNQSLTRIARVFCGLLLAILAACGGGDPEDHRQHDVAKPADPPASAAL
jgi:hypothetical protein